ncbi:LacI family transcriptional regulator [Bacillus sp. HMF5848]|uniref:LacI family DNA-binding transcriptional regulator n=1 Tax=Bacillus sp. HMF5848 TaxID=2495421 RepID=UPI000F7B7DA2|nr:LacI family DNA-binding transcriptional regulator [Bacillus sp. HMF5848]RSK25806.1 LacI family transcriptional regulator [Bacillus sp. HMF5848]
MNRVKLENIADLAGVSITTVSRYFNNPEKISHKTKERIEESIKTLNYTRDNFAKMLSTGESNLIGIILPSLHLSFYSEFLYSTINYCKEKDYNVIVYTSDTSAEEEKNLINSLMSYRIRGLILLSHMLSPAEIEELPLPVVTIERTGGNYKQINSDNFTGGRLAAELLIKNGCDAFVHINNGLHMDWPSYKRILGFELLLQNQPYEKIIEPDLTNPFSDIAFEKMTKIFNSITASYSNKKIGIFCSNDNIANLLEKVCLINHVKIPEQIEIVGYDNAPISSMSTIPITSIAQNINLMTKIAVDSIDNYDRIESLIPATLIEKNTTSKTKHK